MESLGHSPTVEVDFELQHESTVLDNSCQLDIAEDAPNATEVCNMVVLDDNSDVGDKKIETDNSCMYFFLNLIKRTIIIGVGQIAASNPQPEEQLSSETQLAIPIPDILKGKPSLHKILLCPQVSTQFDAIQLAVDFFILSAYSQGNV